MRLVGSLEGIYLIDLAVLGLLLWGTWTQRPWAWWGSAAYYAMLALAWLATFVQTPYAKLLVWLRLAPTELNTLSGMPLQGYDLASLPRSQCSPAGT